MPRVKMTFGFDYAGYAPTETYISQDVSATTAGARMQELIDARQRLLPNTVGWRGIRFSYSDFKRRSVFYPPGQRQPFDWATPVTIPRFGSYTPSIGKDDYPDQVKAALLLRLTYDIDRTTSRYMSMVPDNTLGQSPTGYFPAGDARWKEWFDAFCAVLVNRAWVIRAQKGDTLNPKVPIIDWVQEQAAPSRLGFVLPAAPPFGAIQGEKVKVESVRRKGTDSLSYNGNYIVGAINTTLQPGNTIYYLRGTEDGDVESIKLLGTARRLGYDYFPILKVEGITATTHKRGNSFGRQRGRLKKRASLDP